MSKKVTREVREYDEGDWHVVEEKITTVIGHSTSVETKISKSSRHCGSQQGQHETARIGGASPGAKPTAPTRKAATQAAAAATAPSKPVSEQSDESMVQTEHAWLEKLSEIRQNPTCVVAKLEDMLKHFHGKILEYDGIRLMTQEGPAAVKEAIEFLKKQKPLSPLAWREGLAKAARSHAAYQSRTNTTGHTGENQSSASDRVEQFGEWERCQGENITYGHVDAVAGCISWLVDDGVSNRGHRTNIFNPGFHVAGIGINTHGTYGHTAVCDFAGDFVDK
eukprot:TRINITY_DN15871_c0_g1_i1.p1 TRINITY_DN15871_c0_g1~~TRINITY_DN15871_c0_g1_i1.p1  ORF type:complete len:279 (+),score=54.54 TRINITY_DN15871_c0_g1_i1:74-910(+)